MPELVVYVVSEPCLGTVLSYLVEEELRHSYVHQLNMLRASGEELDAVRFENHLPCHSPGRLMS